MYFGNARQTELLEDRALELDLARSGAELALLQVLLVLQRRIVHAEALDEVVIARDGKTERRENVEVRVLELRPGPVLFGLTAGKAQVLPDVVVGLALVHRPDGALGADDGVGDAVVGVNHRALHGTGNRQHEVGHEGRRGHEVLEDDQELDLLAGLEGHLRVAIGRKRIGAADEQRADLIRVAREDGLEDGRAMGLAHPLGGERLAPLVLGDLGETLVAGQEVILYLSEPICLARISTGRRSLASSSSSVT